MLILRGYSFLCIFIQVKAKRSKEKNESKYIFMSNKKKIEGDVYQGENNHNLLVFSLNMAQA